MACVAHHRARVKCDLHNNKVSSSSSSVSSSSSSSSSCARCLRLEIPCVPHVSQQGKHLSEKKKKNPQSKKRRVQEKGASTNDDASSSSSSSGLQLEHAFVKNAKIAAGSKRGTKKSGGGGRRIRLQHHYGLNHIVRQSTCLGVRRRSFRLQEMACQLAIKADLSMDQIMCGKGLPREWKIARVTAATATATSNTAAADHLSLHEYLSSRLGLPSEA